MNIFVLDKDANNCAKYLCNAHLNKMVVEHSQMLANCFLLDTLKYAPKTQKGTVRKHSYYNHPVSIWLRQSIGNFKWVWYYTIKILEEREYRGFKPHFCEDFIKQCALQKPDNIEKNLDELTPFVLAMPDQYKNTDPVQAYRDYYIHDKIYNKSGKFMLKYTNRELPEWFPQDLKDICYANM
jgi:hypothetical protein